MKIVAAFLQRTDPRWYLICNHSLLVVFGLALTGLQRTAIQIFTALAVAAATELFWSRIFNGRNFNLRDRLMSSTVAALGVLVFLISRHWWFYGLVSFIAVSSKYLIRRNPTHHIFNPTGFAIVISVAAFSDLIFVRGDQYNGFIWTQVLVVFFGSLATISTRRWYATSSYLITSFLYAAIYSQFVDHPFIRIFGPDFGTEGLLFMFLMFTDPRTSPNGPKAQLLHGFLLGFLNVSFRLQEFAYSQFFALFCVCAFKLPILTLLSYRYSQLQEWIDASPPIKTRPSIEKVAV